MDFLTIIEKALENSDFEMESIERGSDCTPEGDYGSLIVTMADGRVCEIEFTQSGS